MEARELYEHRGITNPKLVEAVVDKWADLLEGLPAETEFDRYRLAITAMQFENQARYMVGLSEDVRTLNVGAYTKSIFPLLKRAIPNGITPELISVQPTPGPVGAIFWYDWVYGSTKGPTTRGGIFPKDFDADYTSEYVNGEILVIGDGSAYGASGTKLTATLAWTPVRALNAAEGYAVIIRELNASTGATVQEVVDDGSGGFTGDIGTGQINYSNGAINNFAFTAAPASGNPVKVYYYYDGELNTSIPEMQFDIKVAPVTPKARRAKTLTSQDAVEDLKALHGLDADSVIVANLGAQFALEIDRYCLGEMFKASVATTDVWDRAPPSGINELDHLRSIFTVMSTVSNIVQRKTLRAPANFAVGAGETCALFDQFMSHMDYRPIFVPDGQAPYTAPADMGRPITQHGQFGIHRLGLLKNRWTLYEDPFFSRDFLMLGLKGQDFLDAGAVYAPYIPIQFTSTFLDPADNSLRKGVRTRFAFKLVRPDYYSQIRLLNM